MARSFKRQASSSRPPRRRRQAAPRPDVEVVIDRLGAQGDGIADPPGGPRLYVAGALPGETVRARPGPPRGDGRMAEVVEVVAASPDRVAAPCPHVDACGGCALQHLAPAAEAAWKRDLVSGALAQRGFAAPAVAETVRLPPRRRRRATLGYRRTAGSLILGFTARHSHALVDLATCLLLRPEIEAALPALRRGLAAALPPGAAGEVMIVATEDGLDLRLSLAETPGLALRESLAALAEAMDAARLVLRLDGGDEPLAVRRPPTIRLGTARLPLPTGAFLQPSAEGEAALLALVRQGLDGVSGPVADLFCGLGTFALPLAERHPVRAYDADAALITPLAATGRVRAETRDLFRNPLSGGDLAGLAAAVLDPPRAGARAQTQALAEGGPDRLVAVSCNPATFARDARTLHDAGYALGRVTPVDQFGWSPHVELVAVFDRTR
jgi:23S rRNA (uracil1939-C5)-methyltransferase